MRAAVGLLPGWVLIGRGGAPLLDLRGEIQRVRCADDVQIRGRYGRSTVLTARTPAAAGRQQPPDLRPEDRGIQ